MKILRSYLNGRRKNIDLTPIIIVVDQAAPNNQLKTTSALLRLGRLNNR
jgi:hypothetical protein